MAALLLGGTEKLRRRARVRRAAGAGRPPIPRPRWSPRPRSHRAERVFDLSDEPVLREQRAVLAGSHALAAGLTYRGADFDVLAAPARPPVGVPTMAVIGTGKRIGKTAVSRPPGPSAHGLRSPRGGGGDGSGRAGAARRWWIRRAAPIGAGRVARRAPAPGARRVRLPRGRGAGRVPTVGARRCGGGLAGAPSTSNVEQAVAELAAAEREPDLLLLEGSGAAVPPVAAERTDPGHVGCPAGTGAADAGLGPYRVLVSDMVVIDDVRAAAGAMRTGASRCEPAVETVSRAIPVVATVLRPVPAEDVAGARVALLHHRVRCRFTDRLRTTLQTGTAPRSPRWWARCRTGRRCARRLDAPGRAMRPTCYLVEIKAAAIDVVAEAAAAHRGASDRLLRQPARVRFPGRRGWTRRCSALADEAVADMRDLPLLAAAASRRGRSPGGTAVRSRASAAAARRAAVLEGPDGADARCCRGSRPSAPTSSRSVIEREVGESGADEMPIDQLHRLVEGVLGREETPAMVARYHGWQQVLHLDRPLVLLIGGATGTGKSSLATEIAFRLGISRITSTDVVRQVDAGVLRPGADAGAALLLVRRGRGAARSRMPDPDAEDRALYGFIQQAEQVAVGANAVVERAVLEGLSTVVEGVHLVPGLVAAGAARGRRGGAGDARDHRRGEPPGALLCPRLRVGRDAGDGALPEAVRRDPPDPGLPGRRGPSGRAVPVIEAGDPTRRCWRVIDLILERATGRAVAVG